MNTTKGRMPPPFPPHLLTAEELARRLSMGVRTVWRLVEQGKLPQPLRFSRKLVRFRWPDVEAHLAEAAKRGRGEGEP